MNSHRPYEPKVADLSERRARHSKHVDPGDGGPHDPTMQTRVAILEKQVDNIVSSLGRIEGENRENFRWMLGGFATLLFAIVTAVLSLRAEYRDVANVQTASGQSIGAANNATLAANSAVLEQIRATRDQIERERQSGKGAPASAPPTP